MLLSNLFRILNSYKFSIFKIIFFEILYIVKGYKGNKFNLTKNETMSDNIPCPYYFLMKIKKVLKQNGFKTFLDLGSGSGRTIDFFNKNFSNCEFIGVEYLINQCNESKKIFANNKNIKIIQSDFTKINLTDLKPDCLYLNNPFRNYNQTEDFLKKIIKSFSNEKNILFIFVNYNKNIFKSFKNIKHIDSYYISDIKGYSIFGLYE